jgi:hypothetical protein
MEIPIKKPWGFVERAVDRDEVQMRILVADLTIRCAL